MKRFLVIVAALALVAGLAGCSKVNDLEKRVDDLESKYQMLENAVKNQISVQKVEGQTIYFSDGTSVTVKDGKDGKDGKAGKDGDTLIGKIEISGKYVYVTLADGQSFVLQRYSSIDAVKVLRFVSEYNDCKGSIGLDKIGKLDFLVSPSSAAEVLDKAQKEGKLQTGLIINTTKTRAAADEITHKAVIDVANSCIRITDINLEAYSGKEIAIALTIKDDVSDFTSEFVQMVWAEPATIGGVTYAARKMKDGKVWMTENLRYIPEGYTPSNDITNVKAGIYYPVTISGEKAVFSTEDAIITKNGYLYQSEVALGLKVGDITTEAQAKALEGAQGICPKGWHIPTDADIMGLVGKAVTPYTDNPDAPYYDKATKKSSMELLNNDGFNIYPCGAVSIVNMTSTTASLMGYLKTKPGEVASGYICGSSFTGTQMNKDKTEIVGFQFLGIMPMLNNGTANGSKLSHRIAASVRCVQN